MNIKQIDIAQMLFTGGLLLLAAGVILIPSPRFMETIGATIAYLSLATTSVVTGWKWINYIETKHQEN